MTCVSERGWIQSHSHSSSEGAPSHDSASTGVIRLPGPGLYYTQPWTWSQKAVG